MGDEVGCSLLHIARETASRNKEKLKKIIKDVKNPFKRQLVKAGMLLFAKLEMRGSVRSI